MNVTNEVKEYIENNHDVLIFFGLVISISWIIWLPAVLTSIDIINLGFSNREYELLNLIGGSVPTIVGLIFIYLYGGFVELKKTFVSTINVKNIKPMWFLTILLLIPAVQFMASQLNLISGGKKSYSLLLEYITHLPWLLVVTYIWNILPLANPMREEYGWRGYATHELEKNSNSFINSLLVGIVWGIWHLPLYFFPSVGDIYTFIPFPIFVGETVLLSIIMTWIYNNTNQSMLAMIMFHATLNISGLLFLNYKTTYGLFYNVLLEIILVVVILSVYGHQTMVRSDRAIVPEKRIIN